ncbi:MAG: DUF2235 domain-containing protein [Luteibacter sp.]
MKRIIVCADGTWNVRDQINDGSKTRRPTNVTKIARAILPTDAYGVTQVVIYREGVGTGPGLDKLTGGAFGSGIEDNIVSLYRSVLYNYEPDDELFFFGFSRGAFTVRSLAGFIVHAGLLGKSDDYYTPDFYACYEGGRGPGTPEWTKATHKLESPRLHPKIKMLGVWDTVGSLGAPGVLGQWMNSNKYQYHKVGLFPDIENAFHALAIDEQRKPFVPTLWESPPGWAGHLEQVWFAGVHCNVGGGYPQDGLANEAMYWLLGEAAHLGLAVDCSYLAPFAARFDGTIMDSMDFKYQLMGKVVRPIGETKNGNEAIHESVVKRLGEPSLKYAAANALAFLKRNGQQPVKTRPLPCPPVVPS